MVGNRRQLSTRGNEFPFGAMVIGRLSKTAENDGGTGQRAEMEAEGDEWAILRVSSNADGDHDPGSLKQPAAGGMSVSVTSSARLIGPQVLIGRAYGSHTRPLGHRCPLI